MKGRLLTWDDFYDYMSNRKKSMKFNAKETGQPIVVQVPGVLKFEKSENTLTNGLTPVRLQACHTEKNLNKSSVPYEVMRDKLLPSFKNRPILGYIHDVNGVPQFYEHNAHEEDGKIVYDEIAIGNIPETNNAELIYDEEKDRYNVMIDGYLYDEYTKATEIVEREGECPCSVEISIESMKFDAKDKTLIIEDGYFSGVTILGYDENGKKVKPGMENSNVKLKDFYMSNNSILNDLSNQEQSKLIETLNNLNDTLSKMNFSSTQRDEHFKEGGNQENTMTKFEELLSKYNKTAEDITFEYKELSDEDLEKAFAEAFEEKEPDEEPKNELEEDPENKPKENEAKTDFMKTFSLSHEDIRTSLYALLAPFEETLNEWYWIVNVYDDNFIYQSNTGNYYKQGYSKTEDTVAGQLLSTLLHLPQSHGQRHRLCRHQHTHQHQLFPRRRELLLFQFCRYRHRRFSRTSEPFVRTLLPCRQRTLAQVGRHRLGARHSEECSPYSRRHHLCQKQPRWRTGVCIHTGKREITARFTTPNKMLCIPLEKVLVASVACIGIFSPYRHDGLLKSP